MNHHIVQEIPTTQKHKMTIYYQSKESYRYLMNSLCATENLEYLPLKAHCKMDTSCKNSMHTCSHNCPGC